MYVMKKICSLGGVNESQHASELAPYYVMVFLSTQLRRISSMGRLGLNAGATTIANLSASAPALAAKLQENQSIRNLHQSNHSEKMCIICEIVAQIPRVVSHAFTCGIVLTFAQHAARSTLFAGPTFQKLRIALDY